ncbi:MAG: hypothetical protein U0835_23935 [Isosphaeraceae bacterium]
MIEPGPVVREFSLDSTRHTTVTERADGSGDLLFHVLPKVSPPTRLDGTLGTGFEGFLCVAHVRSLQQMIFDPDTAPTPVAPTTQISPSPNADQGVWDRELDG